MRTLPLRAALISGSAALLGTTAVLLARAPEAEAFSWWAWATVAIPVASLVAVATAVFTHASIARRADEVARFVEEQVATHDYLRRLPDLGRDEIGRTAEAINALLANITNLRVSLIDQGRELAATQEELRLKEALAAKTGELEQRLRERALFFDVLRVSATEPDLVAVLDGLAKRLGADLRLREVALLLREVEKDKERFVVRAAHGFAAKDAVLGRAVARGEGIAGEVARARHPIVISHVQLEPQYLAFWGEAPREGSFAAFPVEHRGQLIALLAVTRPANEPLSDVEIRLLGAICDQLALAIRHAQLVEELRSMSTHDELTGLANRRLLDDALAHELDRAVRFDQPLTVLVVDIDHFKMLNDRCGHLVGDQALAEVAHAMQSSVRRVDTVARTGGEEFVIVLPKADLMEGAAVADKLRRAIASRAVPGGDGQPGGRLTVSVGVAAWRKGEDAHALLERADQCLYLAKQRGRNRVALFREELPTGPHLYEPA